MWLEFDEEPNNRQKIVQQRFNKKKIFEKILSVDNTLWNLQRDAFSQIFEVSRFFKFQAIAFAGILQQTLVHFTLMRSIDIRALSANL